MKIYSALIGTPSVYALNNALRSLLLLEPHRVMLADERNRFVGVRRAARDRHVLDVSQRRFDREQGTARPLDQPRPHFAREDQRRVLKMAAPSLAACINPGPPPVMMSQPISASAAATRLVSS